MNYKYELCNLSDLTWKLNVCMFAFKTALEQYKDKLLNLC